MIDKIDGIKILRKSANIIENCDKEKCCYCPFYDICRILIDKCVEFTAIMQDSCPAKFKVEKLDRCSV
jgi:hypothetical protein